MLCYILQKTQRGLTRIALVVSRVLEALEQSPSANVRRHFHHNVAKIASENHKQHTLTTPIAFT